MLEGAGVSFATDHASGRASLADLRRLATALDPGRVVPIHTERAAQYERLFGNAEPTATENGGRLRTDNPRNGD